MITVSFFNIVAIFLCFCLAWILTSFVWKTIESRIIIKRQNQMMDAAYAKLIRLCLRAAHDFKGIKEVINRELDQM